MKRNPILYYIGQIRDKGNKLLIEELEKKGLEGIVPSHGALLMTLYVKGELPMKEIATHIKKDKSTVTALVNKLINYGYIQKKRCMSDSRSTIISLTKKGLEMKASFEDISESLYDKIDNALTKDEKETLTELLFKLNNNW